MDSDAHHYKNENSPLQWAVCYSPLMRSMSPKASASWAVIFWFFLQAAKISSSLLLVRWVRILEKTSSHDRNKKRSLSSLSGFSIASSVTETFARWMRIIALGRQTRSSHACNMMAPIDIAWVYTVPVFLPRIGTGKHRCPILLLHPLLQLISEPRYLANHRLRRRTNTYWHIRLCYLKHRRKEVWRFFSAVWLLFYRFYSRRSPFSCRDEYVQTR